MPYKVRKSGDKWETYNPESGKVYGTHEAKKEAEAQQRALYANAPPNNEGFDNKLSDKLKHLIEEGL